MTIQASLAGEHREATAMFASKDGAWIPVPVGGGGGGGDPVLLASGVVAASPPVAPSILYTPNFVPSNTGPLQRATIPAGAVPTNWSFGSAIAQSPLLIPGVQFGDTVMVKVRGASFRMERPLTSPAAGWTDLAASAGGGSGFLPMSLNLFRVAFPQGEPLPDWIDLGNGWRGRWEVPGTNATFMIQHRLNSLRPESNHMWPLVATLPDLVMSAVVTGPNASLTVACNLPSWGGMGVPAAPAIPAERVVMSAEWPVVEVWSND